MSNPELYLRHSYPIIYILIHLCLLILLWLLKLFLHLWYLILHQYQQAVMLWCLFLLILY